ncbi:hypothetical protein HAX54_048240, partial [Datura stramonium]|nr:hypothetical protein [Datura stramonium]
MPQESTSWSSLFTGNRLQNRGMNLSYVAPVVQEGKKVVQLQALEVYKKTEKWRKAIILYVVGESPAIGAIERYLVAHWALETKPK